MTTLNDTSKIPGDSNGAPTSGSADADLEQNDFETLNSEKNDVETFDLETLADEFVAEYRAGGSPNLDDYARRAPDFADEIRELFPTLLLLEKGGTRETLSNFSNASSRLGFALNGIERLKNYRLVREIGRGGMGVVYEAWDETLERVVALKVMKIFPGEEEQTIERFQREAKLAARLHHTNIVPVYGSDVVDDKFFYVMQRINGISLEQFLHLKEEEASQTLDAQGRSSTRFGFGRASSSKRSRNGAAQNVDNVDNVANAQNIVINRNDKNDADSFAETEFLPQTAAESATSTSKKRPRRRVPSPSGFGTRLPASNKPLLSVHIDSSNYYQRVCDVGIQTAQGLDYAHRHQIVHRDVKPSNLVVDDDGVVWITDFGLAKPTNENNLTRQGQLIGTLRYLAPETLEGKFSPLSDVYSLGLTLYELLTFSPAFDETTYTKLLGQVADGRLVRPRKINPKIPLDLETIILKATEKSIEKRYASAGELADDLQRFLDDRPIRARRVGPIERAWRWTRRNRLVSTLLGSIFLLVTLIFVGVSNAYFKSRELLDAKKVESQRAQRNLDLALDAFNDVFESLGDGADVDFNFLNESGSFVPNDEPAITEKDARVLENLLRFYDDFAKDNENDPALLLKSARAYAKIGHIRRILGRSNEDDAFKNALVFYRQSLEFVPKSKDERFQTILEKAGAFYAMFRDGGTRAGDSEKFLKLCDESLAELSEIPDDSSFADARRRLVVELRFERAVANLEKYRRDRGAIVGFFDVPTFDTPSPEFAAYVQRDFDAVRRRLDAIDASNAPPTPENCLANGKFNAFYSVWRATLGDVEGALYYQRRGLENACDFARLFPDDSRSYIATIIQNVVKSIVDNEIQTLQNAPEADADALQNAEKSAVDAANELAAKSPNIPQFAIFQIVVHFHFAKREAVNGNLERAEELLQRADALMKEFCKNQPNYDDFQFFGPLHSGYAELLIAEERFDEAEAQISKLERALADKDERARRDDSASSQSGSISFENVERLRRLLDEGRAAATSKRAL